MELDRLPSTVIFPPAVTLTFDLLTPKSNQHIYKPKYICKQIWVKFPLLVFGMWCSRDALTHSLTHGRTDPNTSAPLFNGGGGIITNQSINQWFIPKRKLRLWFPGHEISWVSD